jgi:hypothetical protein
MKTSRYEEFYSPRSPGSSAVDFGDSGQNESPGGGTGAAIAEKLVGGNSGRW